MNPRAIAIIFVVFILSSLASAQIDNCCNIDRQCSTEKQWIDGFYAFQNNQCTAPAQPQSQTSAAPASNIDNCCGIDRQCQTDQEWTDGYWAFQWGQCAAPAQPQTQTSAAPASAALPSNIDNCCFVDRQCHSDWDWTVGYYAFLDNQCRIGSSPGAAPAAVSPASTVAWTPNMTEGVKRLLANPSRDPFNNCCYMHYPDTCHSEADWRRGYQHYQENYCPHPSPTNAMPEVVGNAVFRKLVDDALGLMRIHTPEWVDYIRISGVQRFEQLQNDVGGGFFNTQWMVGHSFYTWQLEDPNWAPNPDYVAGYAGGITHEACHAIKQRVFTQTVDWANELPCVEAQYAVIRAIKPDSKDIGWLRDLVGDW